MMSDYNASQLATNSNVGATDATKDPISAQNLIEIRPIKYRMRGYYVGGATYEFWTVSNPSTPNPSGNPLINKVVDSIISTV